MKQRKFTTLTFYQNGERIRRRVAYRSAAELADKKRQIELEIERSSHPLFSDVADQWWEEHEQQVEHYTAESYKAPLRDLKAAFGDTELLDITSLDIQAFLNRMSLRGYARQTINLRKITMSLVLDWATLHGLVGFNVAKVCKVPKTTPRDPQLPPTPEEVARIHAAPDSFWKRYYLLLMYTGLRREEALALTKGDLDFDNCTIRVDKALIFENNVPVVRHHPKTAAGIRSAPFPMMLHQYFTNAPEGLIFAVNGAPINKGRFDKGIAKFKRETGITCNSHQLRHYFASICHGVIDAKDAQHLLGHAKVSTTLDIYTNLDKQQKRAAIDKINAFIAELTTA